MVDSSPYFHKWNCIFFTVFKCRVWTVCAMTHSGVHSLVDDPYAAVFFVLERVTIEIRWKHCVFSSIVGVQMHHKKEIILIKCCMHNMMITDNFIIIVIIICHPLGLNIPISASSNSLIKCLPCCFVHLVYISALLVAFCCCSFLLRVIVNW